MSHWEPHGAGLGSDGKTFRGLTGSCYAVSCATSGDAGRANPLWKRGDVRGTRAGRSSARVTDTVSFLKRFFGRELPEQVADEATVEGREPIDTVSYKDLMRQLSSASEKMRHDSAMLLSALGHREAIRPLIRSYLTYGDEALLGAIAGFGPKVTMIAAREARDMTLSSSQRARLMRILGETGDPGAATLVLPLADDKDVRVHVAACGALSRLGDPRGVDRLADDLFRLDPRLRSLALEELQKADDPRADAAIEDYVQRYLAAGGAVPSSVHVAMPLLVDRDSDLAQLIGEHVELSQQDLTVVTGPAMDSISEGQREELSLILPSHRIVFVTPRHSPDEQESALEQARESAVERQAERVVVVGPLPSPESAQPLKHFLRASGKSTYTARIMLVGPQRFALVMEWWRYVTDRAEVPTELEVVLTNLVFGGDELTSEEMSIYRLSGETRRDDFARAFLAQL